MRRTYEQLREAYPEFRYEGFELSPAPDALRIRYSFSIPGLSEFHPTWEIPCKAPDCSDPVLRKLVFALGLAELPSYWKITCSPNARILCGGLTEDETAFWKKLSFHGLGEFFYRNGIDAREDDFMNLQAEGEPLLPRKPETKTVRGLLIPVGGGKDSIVTLNLLKDRLGEAKAFQIGRRHSAEQAALYAGIAPRNILCVKRTLDPNMLALNKEGFLNGHTPFSAVVAFSGVLTAYLHGLRSVVLSNESSASESTVLGGDVNHQYSKSFEFECDFRGYAERFLGAGVDYFSLLRPLTEFQIARCFASLPKIFHETFRSCNAGAKTDSWCGRCAKCLFVAVILSPFLTYGEISRLLGADILDNTEMLPVLRELCGLSPNKPFECVGSREEANIALTLGILRAKKSGEKPPALAAFYEQTPLFAQYQSRAAGYGTEWDNNHNLPKDLEQLVRNECVTKFSLRRK